MTARPSTEQLLLQVLLRAAQNVLGAMARHGPDSEQASQASRQLERAFGPVWNRLPYVELASDGRSLMWGDHVVLDSERDAEQLVATLVASDIYAITLLPGVEHGDVTRFLELVDRKRRLDEDGDQDLVLQLFRADLDHLRYTVGAPLPALEADTRGPAQDAPDDAGGTSADALSSAVDTLDPAPPRPDAAAIRARVRAEMAAARAPRAEDPSPEPAADLHFLNAAEIEYLQDAFEREYAQDHSRNVLALLLDILELHSAPEVRDEVIGVLERFLPYLLGSGRFASVAYLTGELRKIARSADLDPGHKAKLDALRVGISDAGTLRQLFQILDDGTVEPSSEELGGLLGEMRHEALQSVLVWMGRLSRPAAKAALVQALDDFFRQWPAALAPMTASEDRAVAQRALGIAARLQMPEFIEPVGQALDAEASSTRRAAVATLAALGGAPALRLVVRLVDDPEPDVRMAVYRTFTGRPYRGAQKALEDAIATTDLEARDLSERRALFVAYGAVAGAAGVSLLEPILMGRGGLRRRPSSATRACAAVALGAINSPAARFALEQASSTRDPLVRSAAGRALRTESES